MNPNLNLGTPRESFLDKHLDSLHGSDSRFVEFWNSLDTSEKRLLAVLWRKLDEISNLNPLGFDGLYLKAFEQTKRLFLRVQEKEPSFVSLPADWSDFILNDVEKTQYFVNAKSLIAGFVGNHCPEARFYGGIKSDHSIRKKIEAEDGGMFFDLWDVIRFRIVIDDIRAMVTFSLLIWENYFDSIVKCRNFYFRPRNGPHDPYRAVHFELLYCDKPFELQIMSSHREAICLLDHQFILKRNLRFISPEHEKWLRRLSKLANVLEVEHVGL